MEPTEFVNKTRSIETVSRIPSFERSARDLFVYFQAACRITDLGTFNGCKRSFHIGRFGSLGRLQSTSGEPESRMQLDLHK